MGERRYSWAGSLVILVSLQAKAGIIPQLCHGMFLELTAHNIMYDCETSLPSQCEQQRVSDLWSTTTCGRPENGNMKPQNRVSFTCTSFLIQEEIKWSLNSGNACYHSVQNLLSSRLLSRSVKMRIYKTKILPVVLYGYETWSLFGNRVLRGIFGPKRDELTGEWRKLHNEELRDLYSSPSIIRMIK
jgi:hypothetical protein